MSSAKMKKLFTVISVLIFVSFIMVSPQIYRRSLSIGADAVFHFNRFYELATQLSQGKFNYYQTLFGFNQSGRIINALYGYDFAFFQAVLLVIFKSWLKFQIVSAFLCFFTSGFTMYLLGKYLRLHDQFALAIAILYMYSSTVAYYAIWQAFNGWGAAFLPLLFIPALKAIQDKKKPIDPILLAVPVAILFSTHILSWLIGILAILPMLTYSFFQSAQKGTWLGRLGLAVIVFVLLSANSVASVLDVYSSNNILQPFQLDHMLGDTLKFSTGQMSLHDAGLIFTSIFIFQITYAVLNWKKLLTVERLMIGVGATFLIFSSRLLPWDNLPQWIPIIKLIQFPHRFAMVAYVLLLLGFGRTLQQLTVKFQTNEAKKICLVLLVVAAFFAVFSVNQAMYTQTWIWTGNDPLELSNVVKEKSEQDPQKIRTAFRSRDLSAGLRQLVKGTPDYLPITSSQTKVYQAEPYQLYIEQFIENPLNKTKKVLADGRLQIKWRQKIAKKVIVPVVIYDHSTIFYNQQQLASTKVRKSLIGALVVNAKPGVNSVIVGYRPSIDLKIILGFKFLGLLIVLIWSVKRKKLRSKDNAQCKGVGS
ncbi:hypothetical protein [Enterococcus sp. CSURQ0835]|uniref:hypothetical protein n=1 Tax=Enterococcus sp. CSURQ0835 TaxID=2681394 RepID=UPI00135BC9F0|nr:hypothetical protein [Enterococcus sp. CSURQ0835]